MPMEMNKILKHMAWANQRLILELEKLPDEALAAYIANSEWTVAEILRHICSSASWYAYRLLDPASVTEEMRVTTKAKLEEIEKAPSSMSDLKRFSNYAASADADLLAASQLPEGDVVREYEGKRIVRARSTVISQAIHHATEHRAQLVAALESRGFTGVDLDAMDMWAFCDEVGEDA